MLHIIILNEGFFPDKLRKVGPSDKVVVISSPKGSIPVSAYQNADLKNMEVKLLPEVKDSKAIDKKNAQRISQAMLIGQITAGVKDYEIYTEDAALVAAISSFTGSKKPVVKKTPEKAPSEKVKKAEPAKEKKVEEKPSEKANVKKAPKKGRPKKEAIKVDTPKAPVAEEKKPEGKATAKKTIAKKETTPSKEEKVAPKKKAVKLPTSAEVKKVLGAKNSSYAKIVVDTMKKSNQITFEMDLRMKFAEAGMDAGQCQELARSLNDEYGKLLPASM